MFTGGVKKHQVWYPLLFFNCILLKKIKSDHFSSFFFIFIFELFSVLLLFHFFYYFPFHPFYFIHIIKITSFFSIQKCVAFLNCVVRFYFFDFFSIFFFSICFHFFTFYYFFVVSLLISFIFFTYSDSPFSPLSKNMCLFFYPLFVFISW